MGRVPKLMQLTLKCRKARALVLTYFLSTSAIFLKFTITCTVAMCADDTGLYRLSATLNQLNEAKNRDGTWLKRKQAIINCS